MATAKTYSNGGVTFTYTEDSMAWSCYATRTVTSIQVEAGIKRVFFNLPEDGKSKSYTTNVKLKGTAGTFPDVEELKIGGDVNKIEIENRMFPNVRSVDAYNSLNFFSGQCLVSKGQGYPYRKMLLNAFCREENEEFSIGEAETIAEGAFEGCMSKRVSHEKQITRCFKNAFKGSAFENMHGVHMGILIKAECVGRKAIVPKEVTCIADGAFDGINADTIAFEDAAILEGLKYQDTAFPTADIELMHVSDRVRPEDMQNMLRNIAGSAKSVEILDRTCKRYESEDGLVYCTATKSLLFCPQKKEGDITVREGTVKVAKNAGSNIKAASLTLPDSIRDISAAFCHAEIGQANLGSGLHIIGENAFNAAKIGRIEIPGNVVAIEGSAFDTCTIGSITFSEGLEKVWASAFWKCGIRCPIELPASLLAVGARNFDQQDEVALRRGSHPEGLIMAMAEVKEAASASGKGRVARIVGENGTAVFPREVRQAEGRAFHELCGRWDSNTMEPADLYIAYKFAADTKSAQNTALAAVDAGVADDELRAYVKRASSNIVKRTIEEKDMNTLQGLIRSGLLSKATLKKIAENRSMDASTKSYALGALNGSAEAKTMRL